MACAEFVAMNIKNFIVETSKNGELTMLKPIVTVEIDFDRKRNFVLNHRVLRLTETTINKMRGATPDSWVAIETIINNGLKSGILPMDLTTALLFHAFQLEDNRLTLDDVGDMTVDRVYVTSKILEACTLYWPQAKPESEPSAEEPAAGNPTRRPNGAGSTVGPSDGSSLN